MGQAAALRFAKEGARVWATDLNAAKLKEIDGKEGIRTRPLDVTDESAIAKAAQEVGDIDILFNCAGIVHHGSILDAKVTDWDQAFNVNVKSMFLVTRAFLPGMLKKQKGSIINMASVASSIKGLPNRCVYGASKAAVIGLTKSIAFDYMAHGIRANSICPGSVDSPSLHERAHALGDHDEVWKTFLARQPMGRMAQPEEMAHLLVYLASDESAYATGANFIVDGGITM